MSRGSVCFRDLGKWGAKGEVEEGDLVSLVVT